MFAEWNGLVYKFDPRLRLVNGTSSPGEAANQPERGHLYPFLVNLASSLPEGQSWQTGPEEELDHPSRMSTSSAMLWTNVVLSAPDQLRQRMAWALSQILVLSKFGLGRDNEVEFVAHYYDIFVRHAFGNYRDVLKDVAFHPAMGMYLTHLNNRPLTSGSYPDENLAREMMQLFTVGLWTLNQDGTPVHDERGDALPTYGKFDVMAYAAVWTGLTSQPPRHNIERGHNKDGGVTGTTTHSRNELDPMQLDPAEHDRLPKMALGTGYIADGYPLCAELPQHHFLARSAKYRLLGEVSAEGALFDSNEYAQSQQLGRFRPQPGASKLHAALCSRTGGGRCTFPAEVELDAPLSCHDQECLSDRVRSVEVIDPIDGTARYYEYVRPPCARLAFSSHRKFTSWKQCSTCRPYQQCADPSAPVAAVMCCGADGVTPLSTLGRESCLHAGEFVKYATADARCRRRGAVLCSTDYARPIATAPASYWTEGCGEGMYVWTDTPCQLRVQVHANGLVNLVEEMAPRQYRQAAEVAENSVHQFRIRWDGDRWPTAVDGCGTGCEAVDAGEETCLCSVRVTDDAGFTDFSHGVPTAEAIRARLFIGAQAPEQYMANGSALYEACSSVACEAARADGVVVHVKTTNPNPSLEVGADTIFQVERRGMTAYLMNRVSTVRVGGGTFSFRNPPHHMPLAGERIGHKLGHKRWLPWGASMAAEAAQDEVHALIDRLFQHDNTAPFLATRLIQRLGMTSNPSPRYTKSVADAFCSGKYRGVTYSGRYGDLGAVVSAIILDREARSTTLGGHDHAGRLREPLIKVLHVLRAMEYRARAGREVDMDAMAGRIGMAAFESPTVFNFYEPDYAPNGPIAAAGLVSPEAQLLTAPHVVGLMNGLCSLIDYGLTNCHGGFGQPFSRPPRACNYHRSFDTSALETSDGTLTFLPREKETATAVVDELALLLTDGRLGAVSRRVIAEAYGEALLAASPGQDPDDSRQQWRDRSRMREQYSTTPAQEALRVAQKLIIAAPEFHFTGLDIERGPRHSVATLAAPGGQPFKAIVVLYMNGGLDSWNALVPSSCYRDLYSEYQRRRGKVALNKSNLLRLPADMAEQPCDLFGLHPRLTALQRAYIAGDALAIANIGALVEPTTKEQYFALGAVQLPLHLFAHNIQLRCAQNLHAQSIRAKGILGRTMAALDKHRSRLFSTSGSAKMLEGAPYEPDFLSKESGVVRFRELGELGAKISNITSPVSGSVFAETYKRALEQALRSTEELGAALDSQTLSTAFADDPISMQLAQVAKVLKLQPQLQLERAAFFTEHFGFDTHTDAVEIVDRKLGEVNAALASFELELKAQGRWEGVTVVTVSDFGRTLSSNGQGTDHGWGGNTFVMGGAVKGRRILGSYPSDISEGSDLDLGRGRMLPTTSWEALWNGVLEWFGVEASQMDAVLPNRKNFAPSQLFNVSQMFER